MLQSLSAKYDTWPVAALCALETSFASSSPQNAWKSVYQKLHTMKRYFSFQDYPDSNLSYERTNKEEKLPHFNRCFGFFVSKT